jgi:hypothetical protein
MNEWGFIVQDTFVGIGKSATICKFINCCGCVQMASLVVSKPQSSLSGVVRHVGKAYC